MSDAPHAHQHAVEAAAAITVSVELGQYRAARCDIKESMNKDERAVSLHRMHAASKAFYMAAVHTGCHPFIEFTGLMNEYIKVCERAHKEGLDFTNCNKHSGHHLPMKSFEVAYVNEKLECIFTGRSVMTPNSDVEA